MRVATRATARKSESGIVWGGLILGFPFITESYEALGLFNNLMRSVRARAWAANNGFRGAGVNH